jgi:hypothetical protein
MRNVLPVYTWNMPGTHSFLLTHLPIYYFKMTPHDPLGPRQGFYKGFTIIFSDMWALPPPMV